MEKVNIKTAKQNRLNKMYKNNKGSSCERTVIPVQDHNPDTQNEAITSARFPKELSNIVLDYLDGDIKAEKNPRVSIQTTTLFGKNMEVMWAAYALLGKRSDIEQMLAAIEKNPQLLRIETIAKDLWGRQVRGTLLQIAAMLGDVDLKADLRDSKDRGMVERLIAAGDLSSAEVSKQLECITSVEAKHINHERNHRILCAVQRFGEGLILTQTDEEIRYDMDDSWCQALVDQFNEALQFDSKEITAGYIFDLKNVSDAINWFQENVDRLGGLDSMKSDAFWRVCYGKLQTKLSYRDAQIIDSGKLDLIAANVGCVRGFVGKLTGKSPMPSFKYLSSAFYWDLSRLGVSYYVSYDGNNNRTAPQDVVIYRDALDKIIANKSVSIEKLVDNFKKNISYGYSVM